MKKEKKDSKNTQNICDVTVSSRESKNGTTTYLLRKARPRVVGQPRQSEFSMTWKNTDNLTGKKLDKALNEQVYIFLNEYKKDISGVKTHPKNILFSDYAKKVLDAKQIYGLKKSTLARYNSLLVRINARFGATPVKDITTSSLNDFYAELSKTKIDRSPKAICKVNMQEIIAPYYITKVEISRISGLSTQTIYSCFCTQKREGRKIEYTNAQIITDAINTLMKDKDKLDETNRIRIIKGLPLLSAPEKPFDVTDLFEKIDENKTLSAKTIREYHELLLTILEEAVIEDLIMRNPASRAKPPRVERKEVESLEPTDIVKMRECMEHEIATFQKSNYRARAFLYLAMSTGCRRGEVLGLKWDTIDFDNNTIYIENTLLQNSTDGVYSDTPKTKNSRRKLVLDPLTKKALLEYKASVEQMKMKNIDKWQDTGFIFVRDDGTPASPDSFTDWCNEFSKRNGLPHIHPHILRHTLASIMLENKNLIVVSAYLGHSKPSVTSDIYAHVLKNADKELGNEISKVIMGNTEEP